MKMAAQREAETFSQQVGESESLEQQIRDLGSDWNLGLVRRSPGCISRASSWRMRTGR